MVSAVNGMSLLDPLWLFPPDTARRWLRPRTVAGRTNGARELIPSPQSTCIGLLEPRTNVTGERARAAPGPSRTRTSNWPGSRGGQGVPIRGTVLELETNASAAIAANQPAPLGHPSARATCSRIYR
jgi:hypothetical protein